MRRVIGQLHLRSVLTVLMVGVLVVSCSGAGSDETLEADGVDFPAIDLTDPEYVRVRELLVQEIGIEKVRRVEELIASHVHSIFPYSKYRTHVAQTAELERRSRELYDLSDDERQGVRQDVLVEIVLSEANGTRRGAIARGSGQLHDAYSAGLEECARTHGIASVEDMMRQSDEEMSSLLREPQGEVYRRWVVDYEGHAESLGFTRDELLDVRQSCSRYAAGLPTLDAAAREHLFGLLHQHYLKAVQAWLADDPEALAPTEPVTALDPAYEFGSPDSAVDPGDSFELAETQADPAGGSESPEGASHPAGAALADRLGPLTVESEDNGAGRLELGHRLWPDRYSLAQFRDEVAVRVDSVLVRDGVVRGLLQNMSQRLFARNVTVSVDDNVWVFPLTVQPTEAVPFVIDGYGGPTDPQLIEFRVSADHTRDPDPRRSFYITDIPGHWAERWSVLEETRIPYYANDRPPAGTTDNDLVLYYETQVELRVPTSHPSIADEVTDQTIDDLRIYLTKMDSHGRVLEVREMAPYITTYVGDDGGYPLAFTPVDRLPFRGHSGFLVGFLMDGSPFALTVGGVWGDEG